MMKNFLLILLMIVCSTHLKAQDTLAVNKQPGDTILGVWQTADQKARITISRRDNLYNGKLSNATVSLGKTYQLDLPAGLLGIYILRDFTYSGDNRWDGTIYDPKSKESYKCYLKLNDDGTMRVRGYKGITLFGKSQTWTRLN